MYVMPLTEIRLKDYADYCKRYGKEHDESYITDYPTLPDVDHPTYVLVDDAEKIVGAAALMLTPAFREARKGRFIIFHTLEQCYDHYRQLWEAMETHLEGIENIYLFIPDTLQPTVGKILEKLGFLVQRTSWVLSRPSAGLPEPVFPEGYRLEPLRHGSDEQAWCDIINNSFAHLQGHLHATPERLTGFCLEPWHLSDGLLLLWHGDKAIGTVRVTCEEDEEEGRFAEIGALGVVAEYRKKGLGVALLRAGLAVARKHGLEKTVLSVNAENEHAAQIYLREGFVTNEVKVCYNKQV